eukprot:3038469-Rhodomonas_salina.1
MMRARAATSLSCSLSLRLLLALYLAHLSAAFVPLSLRPNALTLVFSTPESSGALRSDLSMPRTAKMGKGGSNTDASNRSTAPARGVQLAAPPKEQVVHDSIELSRQDARRRRHRQ